VREGSGWTLGGEGDSFSVRKADLLQDRAAMRFRDLARAAKAKKVDFLADIQGIFFSF
jgi:hypothetical protein